MAKGKKGQVATLDQIKTAIGDSPQNFDGPDEDGFMTRRGWMAHLGVGDHYLKKVFDSMQSAGRLEIRHRPKTGLSGKKTRVPIYRINVE